MPHVQMKSTMIVEMKDEWYVNVHVHAIVS